MSLTPAMTEAELERVREQAREHISQCGLCLSSQASTVPHSGRLLLEVRKVSQQHNRRCHTCRTRGESARLEHYKVIVREYLSEGATL